MSGNATNKTLLWYTFLNITTLKSVTNFRYYYYKAKLPTGVCTKINKTLCQSPQSPREKAVWLVLSFADCAQSQLMCRSMQAFCSTRWLRAHHPVPLLQSSRGDIPTLQMLSNNGEHSIKVLCLRLWPGSFISNFICPVGETWLFSTGI